MYLEEVGGGGVEEEQLGPPGVSPQPSPAVGLRKSSQTGQQRGNSALAHLGVPAYLVSVSESDTDSLEVRVNWAHVGHSLRRRVASPSMYLTHFNVKDTFIFMIILI